MADEQWAPIPGFDTFDASTEGRIRNRSSGRVLAGTVTRKGFRQVSVRGARGRTSQFVHRLVALTFLGVPPAGSVIAHRNSDRLDCHPANLELVSPAHVRRKGVKLLGEANPQSKLTADKVRAMRARHQQGESYTALAKEYGITPRAAHLVVTRRVWRHI